MNGTKRIHLLQFLLALLPLLFYFWIRSGVVAVFEDHRPIYRAQKLEDIFAAGAGGRVEAPTFVTTLTHEVAAGETWSGIARRYAVSDANALALANGNIPLMPGVKIKIPPQLRSRP